MAKPIQRQILEQTRELLSDPNNWVQGEYQDHDYDENMNVIPLPRFCLIGAVRHAAGLDMVNTTMRDLERKLPPHVKAVEQTLASIAGELDPDLKEYFMHPREQVTEYNDHDDRTHEEIIALLDKALERI